MRRLVISIVSILPALASCGDDVRRDRSAAPVSGSRLKLEWYFYGDGSRSPNPGAFYDTLIHERCTPRPWSDGEPRCAPAADEAVFTNAECTELVGRADQISKPAVFLGYDQIADVRLPARLYYAREVTAAPASIYERVDGMCVGPRFTPSDAMYFELSGADDAVAFHDGEVAADDRLDLEVRSTDDGLYLPLGLRDRTLDLGCRASGAVCEPEALTGAYYFADSACAVPAVGVFFTQQAPPVVASTDAEGCASFHAIGDALPMLYARSGASCQVAGSQLRGYALGAAIALAPVERTALVDHGHRLQQIVIAAGTERLLDERMFDTVTGLECSRSMFDDAVRCVPADTVPATTLYTQGCAVPVPVAELPGRTCMPIGFATTFSAEGTLQFHAIGEPPTTPPYSLVTGACAPYVPAQGRVVRTIGPALPSEMFVGGHAAGER